MIDEPSDMNDPELAGRVREFYERTPAPAPGARARLDAALERAARGRQRTARIRRGGMLMSIAAALVVYVGLYASRRQAPSVASVASVVDAPEVPFTITAPSATHVSLVGSFNHWDAAATPMHRDPATGAWTAALRLSPGRHVYAYVLDGETWVVDPVAPRAADQDYGPTNTLLLAAAHP
jgi:hypothetical protein